jgi:hypothetical protein
MFLLFSLSCVYKVIYFHVNTADFVKDNDQT